MSRSERRKNRSNDAQEAANLYLSAAAQRREFQALALANTQGEVVAEAKSGVDSAALAAIAPFAQEGPVPTDGLLHFVTRGQALRLRNIDVDGNQMHLMTVGGDRATQPEIENALKRILSED